MSAEWGTTSPDREAPMAETAASRFRQAMAEARFHRFARSTMQHVCDGCHDGLERTCVYCKASV